MRNLALPFETIDDLIAKAEVHGDLISVVIAGTADLRVTQAMSENLQTVDREAHQLRAREVTVNLRDLEFMNSSCFKSFANWVAQLRARPPEQQYTILLQSDANMLWQRRSLHALTCLAPKLVRVDAA